MSNEDERRLSVAIEALQAGRVIPYLGPDALALEPETQVPSTPEALAAFLTARVAVPHKIRKRLTQAAQFIENFKHRKTLVGAMNAAFADTPEPSELHWAIAASGAPLIVDAWYDDSMVAALRGELGDGGWGQIQGLSQSEHPGNWTGCYDALGTATTGVDPNWHTLLYRPLGGHSPAGNYLVSDSDFVEVLTEIDIQTPIPPVVQALRRGRHFLYLGCRFNDQLTRSFARQISKRSSDCHWAVLPEEPTRMEARFLEEQRIERIALPLGSVAARLHEATVHSKLAV